MILLAVMHYNCYAKYDAHRLVHNVPGGPKNCTIIISA